MTTIEEPLVGDERRSPLRVTRPEELMFGQAYAPIIRRLGQGTSQIEQALFQAERCACSSIEADGYTSSGDRDDNGYSEHSRWMISVDDRLAELRSAATELLAALSMECIALECKTRSSSTGETDPRP